jgi:hypothetical protein
MKTKRNQNGFNLVVTAVFVIVISIIVLIGWHLKDSQNNPTKTRLPEPSSESTSLGEFKDFDIPITIPITRQTYTITNGGFRYTFSFIKNSEKNKYSDLKYEAVSTPYAKNVNVIDAYFKPATDQKSLVCEATRYRYKVENISVLGKSYPLCGMEVDDASGNNFSYYYYLRFNYDGAWHDFVVHHDNSFIFTNKLAEDILKSLKVEKL